MTLTLLDFIREGKELGLSGPELKKWAETELDKAEAKKAEERKIEEAKEAREEKRRAEERKIEEAKEAREEKRRAEERRIEIERRADDERREREKFERELRLLERRNTLAQNETNPDSPASKPFKQYKFSPFKHETEDINAFFLSFERQCALYELNKEKWPVHLLPLLSGSCREIFFNLPENSTYDTIKQALLVKFKQTKETFRKAFLSASPQKDEILSNYASRLKQLFMKWFAASKAPETFQDLLNLFLINRIYESCNKRFVTFAQEHDPSNLNELLDLSDKFFSAHPDCQLQSKIPELPFVGNTAMTNDRGRSRFRGNDARQRQPFRSASAGDNRHRANNFANDPRTRTHNNNFTQNVNAAETNSQGYPSNQRYNQSNMESQGRSQNNYQSNQGKYGQPFYGRSPGYFDNNQTNQVNSNNYDQSYRYGNFNNKRCYKCGDPGHLQANCPKFQSACHVLVSKQWPRNHTPGDIATLPGEAIQVSCNAMGNDLSDHIFQGFVGEKKVEVLRDSGANVHGVLKDIVPPNCYTGRKITCVLFGGRVELFNEVSIVVDTPFITGEIKACALDDSVTELIIGNGAGINDPSENEIQEWLDKRKPPSEETLINVKEDSLTKEMSEHTQECNVVTRAQTEKLKNSKTLPLNDKTLNFNIPPAEFAKLQKNDVSLHKYFDLVSKESHKSVQFILKDGLLVRVFKDKYRCLEQLMLPFQLRNQVLSLAHDMPFSAHLGTRRTYDRLTADFYWPGIRSDVSQYCKSCDVCQKTKPKGRTPKAPLQKHLPVISTPFQKCAIDIIGPISPPTEAKNRYILTLVDYASRWIEAIPLRDITTPMVSEALLSIFARIGFPAQIVSDGGPQLVSKLMEEVLGTLGIAHKISTPYHPEANGLCERANGTIKSMIKKLAHDHPKS